MRGRSVAVLALVLAGCASTTLEVEMAIPRREGASWSFALVSAVGGPVECTREAASAIDAPERSFALDENPCAQVSSRAATCNVRFSVRSQRVEPTVTLLVRLCQRDGCMGENDTRPPLIVLGIERPMYLGHRTRVTPGIAPLDRELRDLAFDADGVGCVAIDRCEVEGCTDGDLPLSPAPFCVGDDHFCEL